MLLKGGLEQSYGIHGSHGIHPMEIVLLASFILGMGFADALLKISCFLIRKELP